MSAADETQPKRRLTNDVGGDGQLPTNPVPARVTDIDWSLLDVPHPDPFTMTMRVDASHMGIRIKHVPNTEYVRWMEALAVAHSDALGYSQEWHEEHGLIWFVRRHEIDYLAEVFEDDELVMATWVEDMVKARSYRRYVVYRPSDDTVICRALTVWVLVRLDTRRPQRADDHMAARYLLGLNSQDSM